MDVRGLDPDHGVGRDVDPAARLGGVGVPACWGAQAVFLLWAQTRPDTGTRATKNAFIIYSGVTAWVVWMGASGRLAGWF